MKTPIRFIVMILFAVVFVTHIVIIPEIEVGLDQKLSMPDDSYVLKYFKVKNQMHLYFLIITVELIGINYKYDVVKIREIQKIFQV